MENFIYMVGLLVLGKGLARSGLFPGNTAQVLNLFVIYVSLPALILVKVPELVFSADVLVPVATPWLMLGLSSLMVLLASRMFHWPQTVTGALLLVVCLGNTSFLGIPMVESFFGSSGIPYALLYDQLGSFLGLSTYGALVVAAFAQGTRVDVWQILRRILTFPPFIALLAALGLRYVPSAVNLYQGMLEHVAATLVPVVMVAVGFQLKLRLSPGLMKPLMTGLFVKMAVAPLLALGLWYCFGIGSLPARVAVFEAGMPPMVTAGAIAIGAGLAPELTAAMVGLGIVLSFLTLPVLYELIYLLLP